MPVLTFGETMMRISPADPAERIGDARTFRLEPGGSESNVAVALAGLGHVAAHVTRIPAGPPGDNVLRWLRSRGVDTSRIERGGDRLGCYYTEIGSGPRPSRVTYDRDGSAFATWNPDDDALAHLLRDADWLHVSGITPAISADSAALAGRLPAALPGDARLSVDLNYRGRLWTHVGGDPERIRAAIQPLVDRAFLVVGNETDFRDMLGLDLGPGDDPLARYRPPAAAVFERYPGVQWVAVSVRTSHSASENDWTGLLFHRNHSGPDGGVAGPRFALRHIQDRLGGGDAFAAGIIHGLLAGWGDAARIVGFAVALSALNHTVRGDAVPFAADEVEQVLAAAGSGRVLR